jgi:hypothetical protein
MAHEDGTCGGRERSKHLSKIIDEGLEGARVRGAIALSQPGTIVGADAGEREQRWEEREPDGTIVTGTRLKHQQLWSCAILRQRQLALTNGKHGRACR